MKTTKLCLSLAAAIGAVWLAGCSTPATRISANPEAFAQLTPQQQGLVQAGQVGVGFDMSAVRLALGNPDRITLRSDQNGQTQIWHYVEYAYDDGAYLWGGWGGGGWGYGRGRGRWGGGWGGYWGADPYWDYPVAVYDKFRIEFTNGKVTSFNQELPQD